MKDTFSGGLMDLFWLRKVLTPDQVSTLYKDGILHRDFASYLPGDVVLSWSDILTTGSFHGGAYTQSTFSLRGN